MGHTIGITACAISGNKGTEAMLTTALRLLKARLPDARFVVFSYYAEKDRPLAERYPDTVVADAGPLALVTQHLPVALFERLLGWTGLHARGLLESTRRVAECDLVVDVAGIAFSDGREKYLPFNVLTVLSPLWLGVGVAKMSQALGPFRHRLNRVLARWILRQCRYVAARGELTAEHLRALGIDDAPRCPDIAFLLNELADMTALDASLADRLAFGTGERPLVGLCPSSVVFKACQPLGVDYVAVNARFVDELVRRGYRVLVLPHSQRPGTSRLKNNDLPVVERIVERATDSEEVTALTEELDAIDLRRVIGRCDLFVASRFHSMVASLAMAVPTMVCGWGHKYFEVLDEFALRDYAFDYRALSLERLLDVFEPLARDAERIRRRIADRLPETMARARQQIDAVVALLAGEEPVPGSAGGAQATGERELQGAPG